MNTVQIDLNEYNRLRDRDIRLRDLELKRVVFHENYWNGHVITIMETRDEAFIELTKRLQDANFNLWSAREKISNLEYSIKNRKWYKNIF